ncbi:MAG: TatD family hydrolase [Proteobacteria bacterium]|nr:TatD family hydrolase [Pseudomonadota bacterium]MBU1709219.1 TatD family hydrolase [Pseudomonadota bacterium]
MADYLEDLDLVVDRAFSAGVSKIITVGIDVASSRAAAEIAGRYESVWATVGIHPHNVHGVTEEDYQQIFEIASLPKVVAYGEVGMDLVKQYAPVALQKEHFRKQLRLAKELDLPLIIHDREAHEDILAILKEEAPFPARGVMHCFSGDVALAREMERFDFMISLPGIVTYNNADITRQVACEVSLDNLIVETDGPYLSPVPKRGKRNEPLFVLYTAAFIAQLRNISVDEVATRTTQNAENLFRLK